eukprot:TRINITY_DN27204_c0_g1_i1.p1 TRINITY_DN27204_c0_g1~~TRINITY_DN27204_c0_g1_i1.p1  ORF type:complete len:350 (-),score=72.27 TRINITY_DN27204_c0_g1_i1:312-1361(-)
MVAKKAVARTTKASAISKKPAASRHFAKSAKGRLAKTATSASATRVAAQWFADANAVEKWCSRPALDIPKLLARGRGFAKIRGLLPPNVAAGLRAALLSLPENQWERTDEGDRDDAAYADNVEHRFSITELERDEVLLGAGRFLARLIPGTVPNFAAARYGSSDRIAPHDDLVPESYTSLELRRLEAAYDTSVPLATAARRWRQSDVASSAEASDALERALREGDLEAVRRATEQGAVVGGSRRRIPHRRIAAAAYYLVQDGWKASFGGEFVDLDRGKKRRVRPEFNTLVAFEVPRLHEVAPVRAPPGCERLSLFGWWMLAETQAAKAARGGSSQEATPLRRPAASSTA